MEMMKVEFISIETIKPSSPTPDHLRTHKLSLLDQLTPPLYIPIVLSYPPTSTSTSTSTTNISPTKKSALLKTSLSKTLTYFYPFAGRIKDCYSIDCNDNGATYIEAQVESKMSFVLKEARNINIDMLLQLLPCDQLGKFREPIADERAILAVQVNYFACGGMAIGFCISHVVADGSAAASFLKTWAEVANNGINDTELSGVIYDCTHLFPPQNLSRSWKGFEESLNFQQAKIVPKRFLFDGFKVAQLRNEISNGQCPNGRPTRVEAVSSLISNALIDGPLHVKTVVNLRNRMNPPLPQLCIGNIYHIAMADPVMEKTTSFNSLADKIHESILKINCKYIRQLYGSGGDLNTTVMENISAELLGKNSKSTAFSISSWCRFPFYETDFGWGKPLWFGTALNLKNVALFLDTSDGEGIEAWITLPEEDMKKLEQDPGILAYTSFNPSVADTRSQLCSFVSN